MKKYSCKYCNRKMDVSFLEYKSNSFCNLCFDERAANNPINKSKLGTFDFMGDNFILDIQEQNNPVLDIQNTPINKKKSNKKPRTRHCLKFGLI